MNASSDQMNRLADLYGSDIILTDEQDQEEQYRLIAELEIDSQRYAIMQSLNDPTDEAYVFRVCPNGVDCSIEDISDDDEWERISDQYDQLLREGLV